LGGIILAATVVAAVCASALAAGKPPRVAAKCDGFASPTGSDLRRGTAKHPFRTPRRLLRSLKNGETGCLRGGTYGTVSSHHKLLASGVPGGRRTLTSYPGEKATIAGYVEVHGSYVTLKGLTFDGSNTASGAGACGSGKTLGIQLFGANVVFERNEVYQSVASTRGSAIISSGDGVIIRYNRLHDFGGCYDYDHGVYLGNGDNVQIYGNWIWNNPHGWGVQVYPGPTNARIHDNVVDANGGGFVISDEGSATSTGNQVYNNVVVNSTGMSTPSGYFIAGAGLSGAGPVAGSNNSFTNNAVYGNPVGSAPNVAMAGNITTDPRFLDAAAHNYAVSSASSLASWSLWDGQ
jgi:hypothetical protein